MVGDCHVRYAEQAPPSIPFGIRSWCPALRADEGPLIGTAKPRKAVPGRAQLVTRARGVEVVQTAWTDPTL